MAQLQLEPPEPFNFRTPDDWPQWRRRFEQFRIASGLSSYPAVKQVNTVLYCVGDEAEGVLTSTNVTEDEPKCTPVYSENSTVSLKFTETSSWKKFTHADHPGGRGRTLGIETARQRRAPAAGRVHIFAIDAPRQRQLAISATRKVTTAPSASANKSPKSQPRTYSRWPS